MIAVIDPIARVPFLTDRAIRAIRATRAWTPSNKLMDAGVSDAHKHRQDLRVRSTTTVPTLLWMGPICHDDGLTTAVD